jgi:large subunit ribosomal protein L7Ae
LEKNQASTLFSLLSHYLPETVQEKKQRLLKQAETENKGGEVKSSKPKVLKFGLNHITELVESRKAKLVVIAHDVDPIELVVWLPALCRVKDVPYVIVKGKARLGQLVHQKTVTCVAVTDVRKEDVSGLNQIISNARTMYNDDVSHRRQWGGGIMGIKANHVIRKREQELARERAKMK